MNHEDLEEIWAWGLEKFGGNSVQTNGTLINDRYIQLFRQYNVQVGISIDGPGQLNDARWAGSLLGTREFTRKIESAIHRLIHEGFPLRLMVTLHRLNSLPRIFQPYWNGSAFLTNAGPFLFDSRCYSR